ncbi:alcohol dehydrogenase catalytic domain-containing protein [Jiella sonneratiae]|uniref:Zinc-binding dehydrogenase n=1 Tax=Jiella sonneratiae TaxID=2816856 RepID=A0ABS3J2Z0_9HYPH|nr:zinc-binding dehydrogenase [Jiella sonneratiae]MBO0904023.1 zinc-binding dehydrogenase [Jiella sonneratiae]
MPDIPAKMRALVLKQDGYSGTATGPSIEHLSDWCALAEIPVPQPKASEVLVRIGLANVNPSDLHYIKGEYGQPRRKGVPAGFEGMGEVVAAGEDEAAQKLLGQRVAVSASRGGSGVWAEYALTDARAVVPLHPKLSDADAAALIVNPMTAWAMLDLVRQAGAKGFVMTAGASQLGKLMARLAKEMGLACVATVRREEHRSPLEGLGVGTVLNTERDDFDEMLVAAMRQVQPTILLDAVADRHSAEIFAAMPAGARWVIYGKLSPEAPALPNLGQMVFMRKKIEGFWLTEWMARASPESRRAAFEKVQERFVSGAWKTDVAATLSLDEALDGLAEALSGLNRGKVLIKPS